MKRANYFPVVWQIDLLAQLLLFWKHLCCFLICRIFKTSQKRKNESFMLLIDLQRMTIHHLRLVVCKDWASYSVILDWLDEDIDQSVGDNLGNEIRLHGNGSSMSAAEFHASWSTSTASLSSGSVSIFSKKFGPSPFNVLGAGHQYNFESLYLIEPWGSTQEIWNDFFNHDIVTADA